MRSLSVLSFFIPSIIVTIIYLKNRNKYISYSQSNISVWIRIFVCLIFCATLSMLLGLIGDTKNEFSYFERIIFAFCLLFVPGICGAVQLYRIYWVDDSNKSYVNVFFTASICVLLLIFSSTLLPFLLWFFG